MTVTVFTWDMFKPGKFTGVGHASMHVHGVHGKIYISFWPAAHRPDKALYSIGKVHFMRGDKEVDGHPDWASKPIENLNEKNIIEFWSNFDPNHNLDYQGSNSKDVTKDNAGGKIYNILFSQCSTVVVRALLSGADLTTRFKILGWLTANAGHNIDISGIKGVRMPMMVVPTITPTDVREMVEWVW